MGDSYTCKTCGKPLEENGRSGIKIIVGCPDNCWFDVDIDIACFDAVPKPGDKLHMTCDDGGCGKKYVVQQVDDAVCNS